jgi:hypothetical protein
MLRYSIPMNALPSLYDTLHDEQKHALQRAGAVFRNNLAETDHLARKAQEWIDSGELRGDRDQLHAEAEQEYEERVIYHSRILCRHIRAILHFNQDGEDE